MSGGHPPAVMDPPRTDEDFAGPLYVLTAAEMRAVDARAMDEFGIPTDRLMESAGAGCVEAIERRYGDLYGFRVAVLCGKGHNGGDGLVIARRLAARGAQVEVGLLAELSALEGVVAANARRLEAAGVAISSLATPADLDGWFASAHWDYIVDALLGTGSQGELRGLHAAAVTAANGARKQGAQVIAVDLPTGVDSDSGRTGEPSLSADLTVTFAYPKRAHVLYPGRSQCGAIEVIDIGIPAQAAESEGCRIELFTRTLAASLMPVRSPTSHKGRTGRGLLVGGSIGLTGAVALASESAMHAGLGMVFAAVPQSCNAILEAKLTEPMSSPMPEKDGGLSLAALTAILSRSERVQAIAVGPGLGLTDEAGTLVGRMLELIDKPMVIDADALTALSESPSWWESRRGPVVVTPHVGEMSRLTGMPAEEIEVGRIVVAMEQAQRWGVVVVLKGAPTVIASPEGWATINPSGNPGMASAGMGDVLTGTVLALLAQGLPSYDAARLAVYLHGRAADRICERRGVALTLASEVSGEIPLALAELIAWSGESPLPNPLPEERHRPGEAEPPQDPAPTGGQE